MAIEYTGDCARLAGAVTVEDAEGLLAWLLDHPAATVDLSSCEHCHAAVLQLLMAARPAITAWPADAGLDGWLRAALPPLH